VESSRGRAQTANARRYMTQLCKHWSHRFDVRLGEADGEIELPMGACRLRAEADHLAIDLQCAQPGQLDRMEEVVAVHLNRFAFRDPFEIVWRRA
jgi:uncharacterized protein